MKKLLYILFLSVGFSSALKAQSADFNTYTIYCESITGSDASDALKHYLTSNYADRITGYVANLTDKTAYITTNVLPEDLLQLYKAQGYTALYLSSEGRFRLNDMGYMQWIKEE